ncbi:DNA polymerase iota-like [Diadema antillarum]|uniref:DNA polymerase iota-like n=1 Tax=Diadema antillarum TaxID=105358 RepID=UPI003A8B5635
MESKQVMGREDDDDEEEEDEDWLMPSTVLPEINSPASTIPVIPGDIATASSLEFADKGYLHSKLGHSRTIIHIDLDCFYAQVEMIRNPSLRDKPLGIQQKNIIVTSNYVARAQGVSKLSYIKDAVVKCPELVLVKGEDLTNYREMSKKVTELLEEFCPLVERLGLDENFLDVTDLVRERLSSAGLDKRSIVGHVYKEEESVTPIGCHCGCRERLTMGTVIAQEMRHALRDRLGLTSCAGVATNKLLAKLVGGHHKPNDQTVLFSDHVGHFMGSFTKVRQIPGIGHSTGKKLNERGISTLQDLRNTPISQLIGQFGAQQAETMLRLAHGVDDTPVTNKGLPQSLSDEDSFKKCGTLPEAMETMTGLLTNLIKRLKSDGRTPRTMRLTIRKFSPGPWRRESRQTGLHPSLFSRQDDGILMNRLLDIALDLLRKLLDTSRPFHLTLINICFANLRSKVTKGTLDSFLGKKTGSGEEVGARRDEGEQCKLGEQDEDLLVNDSTLATDLTLATSFRGGRGIKSSCEECASHPNTVGTPLGPNFTRVGSDTGAEDEGRTFREKDAGPAEAHCAKKKEFDKQSSFFSKRLAGSPSRYSEDIRPAAKVPLAGGAFPKLSSDKHGGVPGSASHHEERFTLSAGQFRPVQNDLVETSNTDTLDTAIPGSGSIVMGSSCVDGWVDMESRNQEESPTREEGPATSDIPPEIDRSVFAALPDSMKEELMGNWKRERRKRESESWRQTPPAKSSRKNEKPAATKKKQSSAKTNTITNYFKR